MMCPVEMGMSKQVLKQRRGIWGMNYEKIVKHKERYKDITVCFVKNQSIHKPLNKTGLQRKLPFTFMLLSGIIHSLQSLPEWNIRQSQESGSLQNTYILL